MLADESALEFLDELELPDEFEQALATCPTESLQGLVYRAAPPYDRPPSIAWANVLLNTAKHPPPVALVPLMPLDDRSLACVVCSQRGAARPADFGLVVRWHLDDVPARAQRQILDVSTTKFLDTMATDLAKRDEGIAIIERVAAKYHKTHGKSGKLPRYFDERPIRLAVQNVIVGLAALRYDRQYDAVSVSAWNTCQVPHLAAHEGTRGLAALTLAEAFRCGSTMEVRFQRHPEKTVPATLCQFGRTQGCDLGAEETGSISPGEARALMWAVTKMPQSLRNRLKRICETGNLSPERSCYAILSGTWSAVGVDFMLETDPGTALRVLSGGSIPTAWWEHRLELGLARRAFLADRVFARASGPSGEEGSTVVTFEDDPLSQTWQVDGREQGLSITGGSSIPWVDPPANLTDALLLPRDAVESSELEEVAARTTKSSDFAVFVIPKDVPVPRPPSRHVLFARAPWTLEAVDREVLRRLACMAVTRK